MNTKAVRDLNCTDLFGVIVGPEPARTKAAGKPNGYARPPGGGPRGETCGSCRFAVRTHGGNHHFWKCEILRHRWTHGPGTDIRLKSPACEMFQAKTAEAKGKAA